MAEYQHRHDRAVVRFSGELTHEPAVDLVDTVDMLLRVYYYTLVELHISSPGGTSAALEHWLDARRRWRAAGVRLRTRVVDRAESAAALMLSLADERIVDPGASLLYHGFRSSPGAPVTASCAARMYRDLAALDERFILLLVYRAMSDAEGATQPLSIDVEPSDVRILEALTAEVLRGSKRRPRRAPGLARVLEREVRRTLRERDWPGLTQIYRALCCSELAVSPAVARILRLVDRVGTAEPVRARAPAVPGLTIPEWAPLYPPAGEVPRAVLTRHALGLGDTGSGKTASVVLPVVRAMVHAPPGASAAVSSSTRRASSGRCSSARRPSGCACSTRRATVST